MTTGTNIINNKYVHKLTFKNDLFLISNSAAYRAKAHARNNDVLK